MTTVIVTSGQIEEERGRTASPSVFRGERRSPSSGGPDG